MAQSGLPNSVLRSVAARAWSTGVTDPLNPEDLTPAEIAALDAAAKTLREALDNE